ncbi:MAG: hypothetical protein HZB91_08240 [Elusimicrobia bacterium]|nr:hypothetical protein [Elusimicrobiota bacterium]
MPCDRARSLRLAGGRTGSVLIWVEVTLVILAIMSSLVVRIAMNQHTMVARANDSAQMRLAALAAESQAAACLYDEGDFGRAHCSLALAAACLPSRIAGYDVTFTASGSPPSCELKVNLTR